MKMLYLILILIISAGCTQTTEEPVAYETRSPDTEVPPATSEPSSPGSAAEEVMSGEVTIEIKDFAFVPAKITVRSGTTVTWINMDGAPHTVSEDNYIFESGTIGKGESYTYTFDSAGMISYYCNFHPYMTGSVAVK